VRARQQKVKNKEEKAIERRKAKFKVDVIVPTQKLESLIKEIVYDPIESLKEFQRYRRPYFEQEYGSEIDDEADWETNIEMMEQNEHDMYNEHAIYNKPKLFSDYKYKP